MHNPQWSTPVAALAATGIGGIAMAVAATVLPTDPAGRVLVGIAAIGLLTVTALGVRQRPRLAIRDDNRGITLQRLRGRLKVDRSELSRVRIVRYPRLGRRVPMLEIDVRFAEADHEQLIVLGRWDLGADPAIVFDALNSRGLVPPEARPAAR